MQSVEQSCIDEIRGPEPAGYCPDMVNARRSVLSWPVVRQLTGSDPLARGSAAKAGATSATPARTETADTVVGSVCPYCAVGCGQKVYAKDGKVVQIEGDPDSPISRGRLCPKGSASEQLVNAPGRLTSVLYRRPYGTEWEDLDLETAMDMVADRVWESRERTFVEKQDNEWIMQTKAIGHLGGATLDNEENYLIKKLFAGGLGIVCVSNQARI